jgi:hypothetical protein
LGELRGIKNIKPKRQIEILPYVVAKTETFEKKKVTHLLRVKEVTFQLALTGKLVSLTISPLIFRLTPTLDK